MDIFVGLWSETYCLAYMTVVWSGFMRKGILGTRLNLLGLYAGHTSKILLRGTGQQALIF